MQFNVLPRSVKSVSRAYRKALRRLALSFPFVGAFYVARAGRIVNPENIRVGDTIVMGRLPNRAALPTPVSEDDAPLLLPPLSVTLYKQYVRVGGDGKKRTEYRPVKNPKGGVAYYVRSTSENGRNKYNAVLSDKALAS